MIGCRFIWYLYCLGGILTVYIPEPSFFLYLDGRTDIWAIPRFKSR